MGCQPREGVPALCCCTGVFWGKVRLTYSWPGELLTNEQLASFLPTLLDVLDDWPVNAENTCVINELEPGTDNVTEQEFEPAFGWLGAEALLHRPSALPTSSGVIGTPQFDGTRLSLVKTRIEIEGDPIPYKIAHHPAFNEGSDFLHWNGSEFETRKHWPTALGQFYSINAGGSTQCTLTPNVNCRTTGEATSWLIKPRRAHEFDGRELLGPNVMLAAPADLRSCQMTGLHLPGNAGVPDTFADIYPFGNPAP